jgi:hypothetical protein
MDGLGDFHNPMSKIFTIYHTGIGVLFTGVTVLYIASELQINKDNWIMQIVKNKESDTAAESGGYLSCVIGFATAYLSNFKIFAVFLVWLVFGLLWYPLTNPEYSVGKNLDMIASDLTTAGYLALPSSASDYQLVVTALYTSIGVPLLSIALGKHCHISIVSTLLYNPHTIHQSLSVI